MKLSRCLQRLSKWNHLEVWLYRSDGRRSHVSAACCQKENEIKRVFFGPSRLSASSAFAMVYLPVACQEMLSNCCLVKKLACGRMSFRRGTVMSLKRPDRSICMFVVLLHTQRNCLNVVRSILCPHYCSLISATVPGKHVEELHLFHGSSALFSLRRIELAIDASKAVHVIYHRGRQV